MPLDASIDAGFRRFGGGLWECKSPPESTFKFPPKPIKPFKGKTTTTRAQASEPGKCGVVVVF